MYDEYYFARCCGLPYRRDDHWLRFFGGIADRIVRDIAPRTVLDVGCAMGFLVEALRDRGVEAYGIDISEYAISMVREDIKQFCRVASVLDRIDSRYDLIVCIEVIEHLKDLREVYDAIGNMCASSRDIIFSSTPFDYREATHYSVKHPADWSYIFSVNGFFRDTEYDASFITPWAMRFRYKDVTIGEVVRDLERDSWVHRYQSFELRQALVAKEQEVRALLRENDELRQQLGALKSQLASRGHEENSRARPAQQQSTGVTHKLGAWMKRVRDYLCAFTGPSK